MQGDGSRFSYLLAFETAKEICLKFRIGSLNAFALELA